ncbi:MAG TPA: hypothetical protein VJS86_05430, partial [Arthrobacter sp.]|nr:hypothetical protein [Arthrobacter sp.]
MEVLGNSAVKAGALHGGAPLAAAVPDGWFTGEVFPLDDESAAGGFVYDDYLDAVVPEDPFPGGEYPDGVFPEDPFPEILEHPFLALRSKDQLFADASGATTPPASGLNPDNRVGPAKTLLPADLTADAPELIEQVHEWENIKNFAAGQQARLAVEFEARQRQEQ